MTEQVNPDEKTLDSQFVKGMHRKVYPAIDPTNPNNSAAGKKVLITGASRGIGKAIALSWAQAGAAGIIITGRAVKDLEVVAAELRETSPKTDVVALTADVTSEDAIVELYAKSKARFGIIDVLICNAGVFNEGKTDFPIIGTMDPKRWWFDLEVNVRGSYLMIHHFIKQFNGAEPTGTVIVLTSIAAGFLVPGVSAYSISKLVDVRLVEYLDVEQPGIRAFAVNPGFVPTQMELDVFAAYTIDSPELTGGLSLYLSTPRADHLRGRYISVNWDVDDMEKHKEEITEKGLLKTAFLNAKLGPEGHPFEK
ncbi:NAD(P)-binding protein [Cenococcum geophilum 1.58]|uniref:NAD(P)-binding protein n=1 Tax=Cenococcum geophilum 1.58 TaxID=794803 RepID=UPI0035900F76|nr:NAD(P)-binding protein [Cenococcum geophilum 1.58]